jgi:DNA replication protein DnaC
MANAYIEAREEKQVTKLENHIRRCDLIVIDELGYVPLQHEAAEHLFSFVSQCYEITSLIATTNLPFADWPQVFADDERMAGALLDRLTHHVQIVEMEGESYRLKHGGQRGQGRGKRKRAKGTDQSKGDQSQETDQREGGDAEDTST